MFEKIQCVRDLIAAYKAGDYAAVFEHGGHLVTALGELYRALAEGKVFSASPEQAAEVASLQAELEAIAASPVTFGAPVGKLGDGELLKKLIDLAIKILPLFL